MSLLYGACPPAPPERAGASRPAPRTTTSRSLNAAPALDAPAREACIRPDHPQPTATIRRVSAALPCPSCTMPVPTLGHEISGVMRTAATTPALETPPTESHAAKEAATCPNPGCRQSLVRTIGPAAPWRIAI